MGSEGTWKQKPSISLQPGWFLQYDGVDLLIRTTRPQSSKRSPYVLVELDRNGVTGISHQD